MSNHEYGAEERLRSNIYYRYPMINGVLEPLRLTIRGTERMIEVLERILRFVAAHPIPREFEYGAPPERPSDRGAARERERIVAKMADQHHKWVAEFDLYYVAYYPWHAAIATFAKAVSRAVPELDAGEASPFRRPSVQIDKLIDCLGLAVADTDSLGGPSPALNTDRNVMALKACLRDLKHWHEMLRDAGNQTLPQEEQQHARQSVAPRSVVKNGGSSPNGSNPNWRKTAETLGNQFERERARFPELMHFVVTSQGLKRSESWPWTETGGVHHEARSRPVFQWGGFASSPWGPAAVGTPLNEMGFRDYSTGCFGCGDDMSLGCVAMEAYQRLASRAWECIPAEILNSLAVGGYIDPTVPSEPWQCWTAMLYAIAWSSDPSCGLTADRQTSHEVAWAKGRGVHNIESLIRSHQPGDRVDHGLKIPPDDFFAFLEPDLFLASKLAIDFLIDLKPALLEEPSAPPQKSFEEPKADFEYWLNGGVWRIAYEGIRGEFMDSELLGYGYIAALLASGSDTPISASMLKGRPENEVSSMSVQPVHTKENMEAINEDRDRIERELQVAHDSCDEPRIERLEREKQEILADVQKSAGSFGRDRGFKNTGSDESARTSVWNALNRAYKKFEDPKASLSSLAEHLRGAIKHTKKGYVYRPDDKPPAWRLEKSAS